MYYPGLFESTSPYTTLGNSSTGATSRPFIKPTNGESAAGQDLSSLLPNHSESNKKMVSSLSTATPTGAMSLGSFRTPPHPHFYAGAPATHFVGSQPSNADCSPLMASYPPPQSATGGHLASSDAFSHSSFFRDQTLLEAASTPYALGRLSSYTSPHYPASHYMGNSVLAANYKLPSAVSSYPAQSGNSFLSTPPMPGYNSGSGQQNHPFSYAESFIHSSTDYITRAAPDSAKSSVYTSEQNSFSDHLKRLQESFQAKTSKGNYDSSEPHHNSINVQRQNEYRPQATAVKNGESNTNKCTKESVKLEHSRFEGKSVWNPMLDCAKSQQCQAPHDQSKPEQHILLSSNTSICNTTKNTLSDCNKNFGESKVKQVQHNNNHHIHKRRRSSEEECKNQTERNQESKTKKTCTAPTGAVPTSNGQNEGKATPGDHDESRVSQINLADASLNDESNCGTPEAIPCVHKHKDSKSSKKNNNNRRRRFRSGLDMIRSSRKKTTAKSKSSFYKKDGTLKKEELSTRPETKRLIVNKSLGETLLHRSARNNRLDVVRHCLQTDGCDVNARDNAGYTPLHECASRGNLEVGRLLLQHSADVNASATGGIRPLHDAIENNHIEMVRLLLSYGADPNISTYSGSTPLQLCRSKAMFKFLKGFYEDISSDGSVEELTSLPWKFTLHIEENGFDVFDDVPQSDDDCEDEDQVEIECSEKPLLPVYTMLHKPDCSFYLLRDVLELLCTTHQTLVNQQPEVQISKISRLELSKAVSQLELRCAKPRWAEMEHDHEIEIIYRNKALDTILEIDTSVIH